MNPVLVALVQALVEAFLADESVETDWRSLAEDPGCRGQGMCWHSCDEFTRWCASTELIGMEITRLHHMVDDSYCGESTHWVVIIWGLIVMDLTARQFDDDLPFPHVWILS